MKKIIILTLIFIFCILLFNPVAFASSQGSNIKDYFRNPKLSSEEISFENTSSSVYNILKAAGIGIAVCIMAYIGLSFITANAQKRAAIKERLPFYIAGVIVLIAGVSIISAYQKIVIDATSSLDKTVTYTSSENL